MYPELKKWVKQCVACQTHGYDPDMPDEAKGARNIRGYFRPMKVNDLGFCEECEKYI